jgi:molybdopterin converting factor small subunit
VAVVIVPALLRPMCGGAARMEAEGDTLGAVLRSLERQCPGIYDRVVEDGHVRPELAIALDGEAQALPLHHPLAGNAEITIVPAIGGG